MCDDTGLFQHAIHSVPDRSHGYCVDDNARALLLACALNTPGEERLSGTLTLGFASFVQHAWNPDTRRFRNFMSFDRRWLEDSGSEDSHGRTLWALGRVRAHRCQSFATALGGRSVCRSAAGGGAFRVAARLGLYAPGIGGVPRFRPREMAGRAELQHLLAGRLMSMLASVETPDWVWFEEELAYDNARLPQALIVTGASTGSPQLRRGRACAPCAG